MSTEQTKVIAPQPLALRYTWTPEQVALIKRMCCQPKQRQATDDELALFLHVANSTGLDPLRKQIYAVFRWSGQTKREEMSIQTGVDGFRKTAEDSGKYAGQLGPLWCGPEGQWVDVWLSKDPPRAAKVGILRNDFKEPLWAVATWDQYVQTDRDNRPTKFWLQMGPLMLAKCAEELGIRRAFPDSTSGVKGEAEMMQADREPLQIEAQVVQPAGTGGSGGTTSNAKPSTAALTAPTQPAPAGPSPKTPAEAVAKLQADKKAKKPDPEATGSTVFQEQKTQPRPAWATQSVGELPIKWAAPFDSWSHEIAQTKSAKSPLHGKSYAEIAEGSRNGGRHTVLGNGYRFALKRWKETGVGCTEVEEKLLLTLREMRVKWFGSWDEPPFSANEQPAEEGQYDPADSR
jgi:phage recombination protein Bet